MSSHTITVNEQFNEMVRDPWKVLQFMGSIKNMISEVM